MILDDAITLIASNASKKNTKTKPQIKTIAQRTEQAGVCELVHAH